MIRMTTLAALSVTVLIFANGWEKKEKILNIKTQHGELEIERSPDSGNVDITIDRDKK